MRGIISLREGFEKNLGDVFIHHLFILSNYSTNKTGRSANTIYEFIKKGIHKVKIQNKRSRISAIVICALLIALLSTSVCAVFAYDGYSGNESFGGNGLPDSREGFDGNRNYDGSDRGNSADSYKDKDNFFNEDRGDPTPYTDDGDTTDPGTNDTTPPDDGKDNDTDIGGEMDKDDAKPDDDANIGDKDDNKDDDGVKDGKDDKKFGYTGLIVAAIIAVAVIILIVVMIPTMSKPSGSKK